MSHRSEAHLTPRQLERYLHEHIPISRPLGVRVIEAAAEGVRLGAPLEPNLNDRQTAFGGSLSAVAILAAWSWMYLRLGGPGFGGRIVIQDHGVEYLAPAAGDFIATCTPPGGELWGRFSAHWRGGVERVSRSTSTSTWSGCWWRGAEAATWRSAGSSALTTSGCTLWFGW